MLQANDNISLQPDNIESINNSIASSLLKVLEFDLNDESYGVNIEDAKEVVELPRLTKIPYAPFFVKGAMNLRGEIISVIDIRKFFGLEKKARTEQSKVIITDATGTSIGIVADRVQGTIDIELNEIQSPLLTIHNHLEDHIVGQIQLNDRILVLLDLKKILKCETIERLRSGH